MAIFLRLFYHWLITAYGQAYINFSLGFGWVFRVLAIAWRKRSASNNPICSGGLIKKGRSDHVAVTDITHGEPSDEPVARFPHGPDDLLVGKGDELSAHFIGSVWMTEDIDLKPSFDGGGVSAVILMAMG